jgi:hypothetical protein
MHPSSVLRRLTSEFVKISGIQVLRVGVTTTLAKSGPVIHDTTSYQDKRERRILYRWIESRRAA